MDHTTYIRHLEDETLNALVDAGRAEQERRRVAAIAAQRMAERDRVLAEALDHSKRERLKAQLRTG